MSIIELIISSIAPHECVKCGAEGTLMCAVCARQLPGTISHCYRCGVATEDWRTCSGCRSTSGLFRVQAATIYAGEAKTLVGRLKFGRASAAADDIASLMAERISLPPGVLITHLPTATQRVRQRGYDQAERIARRIAVLSNAQYAPLLARVGTQRQVGQGRTMRRKQMDGAFVAVRHKTLQGRHILLIDDVLTTGASCEAAARVLRSAGAARVSVAVFATA